MSLRGGRSARRSSLPVVMEIASDAPHPRNDLTKYNEICNDINASRHVPAGSRYRRQSPHFALSRHVCGYGGWRSNSCKDAFAIDEVNFLSPLNPYPRRDGYAFEQHVKTANKNRGREVPEEWYEFPVFYFTNPSGVFGHDDVIPYPHYTNAMDYELEIAVVIGKGGINIKAEDAPYHIF